MHSCNVVWFDHDFRVNDQPALRAACQDGRPVIGLFVARSTSYNTDPAGFETSSKHQKQALFNVLQELKADLDRLGIVLYVFRRPAKEVFHELTRQVTIHKIFSLTPRAFDEARVIKELQSMFDVSWELFDGRAMFIKGSWMDPMPSVFTSFRKQAEKQAIYRPLSLPANAVPRLHLEWPDDLETFNQNLELVFPVGRQAAQDRLAYYVSTSNLVARYKETRNGLLAFDDSSKLSVHLAMGTLSASEVHYALQDYETNVLKNESTYWLRFELWWREFFYWHASQTPSIFGTKQLPSFDHDKVQAWIDGQTGYPLVDAGMRELKATGFLSNRARQNVASFFVHYLNQDWQIGADYFAATLIDYDPASNYLNWQYVAGVGHDPRDQRIFNVHKQGRDYDPNAAYAKYWCPELSPLPASLIYPKTKLTPEELDRLTTLGYPPPIVPMPF